MDHQYFFCIREEDRELLVFYRNYDFLVVPEQCPLVFVEDIDEKQIIEMMLNSGELSDLRKKQFKKLLKTTEGVFNFDNIFPFYVGSDRYCSFFANSQWFKNEKLRNKTEESVINFLIKDEVDILGNSYVYERINLDIGSNKKPSMLTKKERVLFTQLLEKKLGQRIPIFSLGGKEAKEINFKKMYISLNRNESRILEQNKFFDFLLKIINKNRLLTDIYFKDIRKKMMPLYEWNIRKYCMYKDKYYLGALLFASSEILPDLDIYLPLVSNKAYRNKKEQAQDIVFLNRQETNLMLTLCEGIDKFLIILPNVKFNFFENVFLNYFKAKVVNHSVR